MITALCGCTILPSGGSTKTHFVLESRACIEAADRRPSALRLILRETTAPQYLNSTRIIYNREANSRDWYKLAVWVVPPPARFSLLLLDRLECENLLAGVTLRSNATIADLSLQSEILEFRHDVTAEPSKAVVHIRMELVDLRNREVRTRKVFMREVNAATVDADGAVTAFNESVSLVLDDAAGWLAESLSPNV